MLVWVIYDISDNKIRSKVSKACKEAGLYRVQKSVFLGSIESNRMDEIAIFCTDIIDQKKDSVYIFPFCQEDWSNIRLIGQAFDEDLVTDEIKSLFI